MTEQEIKEKIKDFFKKHPGEYWGAYKIDGELGFDRGGSADGGHKSWPTHKILTKLKGEGFLEQDDRFGFRLKQ